MSALLEVRCPICHRLLFRASGHGATIEIQCTKCKTLLTWPALTPEVKIAATTEKHPAPPR